MNNTKVYIVLGSGEEIKTKKGLIQALKDESSTVYTSLKDALKNEEGYSDEFDYILELNLVSVNEAEPVSEKALRPVNLA